MEVPSIGMMACSTAAHKDRFRTKAGKGPARVVAPENCRPPQYFLGLLPTWSLPFGRHSFNKSLRCILKDTSGTC